MARPSHRGYLLACLLAGSAIPRDASAQTAEELFSKAEAAENERDFETACPAFARSFQLSDAKGALYRLAKCDDARGGRLATQLGRWKSVRERFTDDAKVVAEADARIRALESKVARLTIQPATPDLTLELDGKSARGGEAIPVDAGSHEVVATSPTGGTSRKSLELTDGQVHTIEIGAAAKANVTPPPRPPLEETAGGFPFTTAGLIAGGVGIAGLTVFAISTPILAGASSDIDEACGEDRMCTASEARVAEAARSDGEGWQIPNAVGLVVGAVGVGLGVTFLVLGATEDEPIEAAIGPGHVTVRGAF